MAQTSILAPGTTGATSTDVVLAAGAAANIGLYVASGDLPKDAKFQVLMDTPGADIVVAVLSGNGSIVTSVAGPGTYRVLRVSAGAAGASVGAFSET